MCGKAILCWVQSFKMPSIISMQCNKFDWMHRLVYWITSFVLFWLFIEGFHCVYCPTNQRECVVIPELNEFECLSKVACELPDGSFEYDLTDEECRFVQWFSWQLRNVYNLFQEWKELAAVLNAGERVANQLWISQVFAFSQQFPHHLNVRLWESQMEWRQFGMQRVDVLQQVYQMPQTVWR